MHKKNEDNKENGQSLISVIVPVYNKEKYIEKCIRSILMQTYTRIELIAVDDGSTDGSLSILESIKKEDDRLKVISKQNGGLVDAVSIGVLQATGEYVSFVDADDYIGKNFIGNLMSQFDESIDIVGAGLYIKDDTTERTVELDRDYDYFGDELERLRLNFFWNKEKAKPNVAVFQSRCNKIYRKSIVTKIITLYQKCKKADMGEDTIFNYLVLTYVKGVRTCRKPAEYYYILRSGESMTRTIAYIDRYKKNKITFRLFRRILMNAGESEDQAYELMYLQIQRIIYEASSNLKIYWELQNVIREDEDYMAMYRTLICNARGLTKLCIIQKYINEMKIPILAAFFFRRIRSLLGVLRTRIIR